ncbi:molybdate ABC transporter substrate-binding protein [Polaromonas sp. JS666]|uniref:molybdate ABC transporter substrate-binding protein n=1 Tax=Polaromonas sp. (strain JS666 / ATCC BAA-500) TaxID=296591 RepID=UPI000046505D|nr:molybdate ABC transporter substrate-binding protein [Polaromonas sp. JS666]ABE42126.1 molybdenum ABC transporter, periplasmic molybdate-binding protein [Polaromonas sp. JS666]
MKAAFLYALVASPRSVLKAWIRRWSGGAPRRRVAAAGLLHLALALQLGSGLVSPASAQDAGSSRPALIAAAANLQPVLAELVPLFERGQKSRVRVNIGSSANLVRQIQQGLPAELFLSADEDFALRLADAGLTPDRGLVYATGRLVLLVPAGSPLALDPQLRGLRSGLSQVQKFAIANPELAPYGRAAVQVLQKLDLWPALQGKIVLGENMAQATQYVSTGAAQAGITALSLALAPELATRVRYVLLPDDLHAPLRQRMVLLKNAGPAAHAFYEFLQSAPAKAVLMRYGYV